MIAHEDNAPARETTALMGNGMFFAVESFGWRLSATAAGMSAINGRSATRNTFAGNIAPLGTTRSSSSTSASGSRPIVRHVQVHAVTTASVALSMTTSAGWTISYAPPEPLVQGFFK